MTVETSGILKGRNFQVWEYRVSHGSLLIRSPALGEFTSNIDIVFKAVIHIIGPKRLGKIYDIAEISDDIVVDVSIDRNIYSQWKLISEKGNLVVVAAFFNLRENKKPVFENYFDFN